MRKMIDRWLRALQARACAKGRHTWESAEPPWDRMGTGVPFAVNFSLTFLYEHVSCRRCGARAVRQRD